MVDTPADIKNRDSASGNAVGDSPAGFWVGDAARGFGKGGNKHQLSLFPESGEESLLVANSRAYAGLPDEAQMLVRGYIDAVGRCDRANKKFTKRVWAKCCNLPVSSHADKIKKYGVRLDVAIRECTIIAGENGAMAGAEALVLLGIEMKRAVLDGRLTFKNVNSSHLKLGAACARMAGFVVDGVNKSKITLTDKSGNSVEISSEDSSDGGLGFSGARDLMNRLKGNISIPVDVDSSDSVVDSIPVDVDSSDSVVDSIPVDVDSSDSVVDSIPVDVDSVVV